jgi:uncharacterized Ntn-hydrolase superfamily protein
MTYSIIAQCPETGAFGGAVGTSALAVGNRCLHVAHGVGAVLSQHRTDPRLGARALARMADGFSAGAALAELAASNDLGWRQLALLDREGDIAVHHGGRLYSIATHAIRDRAVAIGNILANERVTDAMADAFMAAAGQPLERRLLAALAGGREAGGEILDPLRSAALRVTGPDGVDRIDLRIDRADEAVAALEDLLDAYGDQEAQLRAVALTPDDVPIARSLFDASVARIAELDLEGRFPTAARRAEWTISG